MWPTSTDQLTSYRKFNRQSTVCTALSVLDTCSPKQVYIKPSDSPFLPLVWPIRFILCEAMGGRESYRELICACIFAENLFKKRTNFKAEDQDKSELRGNVWVFRADNPDVYPMAQTWARTFHFFPLSISLKDSLLHKTKLYRVSHIHNYDLFLQQTKESSSTDMLQEKKMEYDIMKGNEHPIF